MKQFEDTLAHYGIPGMKWGVRRRRSSSSAAPVSTKPEGIQITKNAKTGSLEARGGKNHGPTPEAMRALALRQKAKASGRHSLTNKQMQDVVTRLDLEAKFAKATAPIPKQKSVGRQFLESFISSEAKQVMKTGKPPGLVQAIIKAQQERSATAEAAKAAGKPAAAAVKAIASAYVKSSVVKDKK